MKYMISIYNDAETNAAIDGPDREEFERVHGALQTELRASGELVDSNEMSVSDARVVRTGGAEVVITEAPFTEGTEFVGGYYLVDCVDIERATTIAARFIEARFSPVEVRALVHN